MDYYSAGVQVWVISGKLMSRQNLTIVTEIKT